MRLEFIERVKGDEILGKSILTNDGSVLLRAGMKLNDGYIKRLKSIGVLYIYIEDDRLEDVLVEDKMLTELKQATMKTMSNVMRNIHSFQCKGIKHTVNTVENLVDYIISMGDINKSIYDIQTYDNYTYVHSLDTCIMSSFLGIASGLGETNLKELSVGAILHDVGKTKVPITITSKIGSLNDNEYREMKKHTIYGREILQKKYSIPESVIKIVEQHHERVDGKGYPYGLKRDEISRFAKVISICDVYDSVSADRCYRKKFSPNDAYELILAGSGTSFDEELVMNFKNTFSIYPLGCCVKLSNGDEGYVIRQNKGFPDRPIIRILYEAETRKPIPMIEVDLIKNCNVTIQDLA